MECAHWRPVCKNCNQTVGLLLKNTEMFWTCSRRLTLFLQMCHIRTVVEHGCVVWQHNVTSAHSDRLEALQKRALRIILHLLELPHSSALTFRDIETLKSRRHNFQIKQICRPDCCFHDLLPPQRQTAISYPVPHVKTRRYCSFVSFALKNYQWHDGMFSGYGVRGVRGAVARN